MDELLTAATAYREALDANDAARAEANDLYSQVRAADQRQQEAHDKMVRARENLLRVALHGKAPL